jgi:hypothetical protein
LRPAYQTVSPHDKIIIFLVFAALLNACAGAVNGGQNSVGRHQQNQVVQFASATPASTQQVAPVVTGSSLPTSSSIQETSTPINLPAATASPTAVTTPRQNSSIVIPATGQSPALELAYTNLYQQANPGVVNIQVQINNGFQSGIATGSGWIYDIQGHIVTNNYVVDNGSNLIVTFLMGSRNKRESSAQTPTAIWR